jgi:hypothetical protein
VGETEYLALLAAAFQLDAVDVIHMYPPQQTSGKEEGENITLFASRDCVFSDYRTQFSVIATDFVFRCPARALARYIVANNNNNDYNNNDPTLLGQNAKKRSSKNDTSVSMYLMSHSPSWDPENPGPPCQGVAVCHGRKR